MTFPAAPETAMLVPETEIKGPDHSSYPKVVVPVKITLVPLVSLVKSRVVPAGTTRLDKVIVEQEALPLATAAAPVVPEKAEEN
jgi:hypothetical protein